MNIIRGVQQTALKVCVYGPEGIGKTTFASQFPNPLFIDTEESTKYLDVARFEKPESWSELLQMVDYVRNKPSVCNTLVLDTADWAERLCIANVCARMNLDGIESVPYGKGYVYASEDFGKLLNKLSEVVERGVNVVITAHAMMRKFEQPDELGAYDRWELKLSKKIAPMVKEWTDILLFANYKTIVVSNGKGKTKAQGGTRVMYTSHHPCWDAKNRQGMPEELPFDFAQIACIVPGAGQQQTPTPVNTPQQTAAPIQTAPPKQPDPAPIPTQQQPPKAMAPAQNVSDEWPDGPQQLEQIMFGEQESNLPPMQELPSNEPVPFEFTADDYDEIYALPGDALPEIKQLYELMRNSKIIPAELQVMCSDIKGYMPTGVQPCDYPADFVAQCLIPNWDSVAAQINAEKDGKTF